MVKDLILHQDLTEIRIIESDAYGDPLKYLNHIFGRNFQKVPGVIPFYTTLVRPYVAWNLLMGTKRDSEDFESRRLGCMGSMVVFGLMCLPLPGRQIRANI